MTVVWEYNPKNLYKKVSWWLLYMDHLGNQWTPCRERRWAGADVAQ